MQKTNTVTEGKWGRDKLENWDRYTYAEVVKVLLVSRVWLFVTPWTVARQAPLSVALSRQEYWSE